MIAQVNGTAARIINPFYARQLNVIANYLTMGGGYTPLWQSFAIMWANVAVLGVLFAVIYGKKGLKVLKAHNESLHRK